MTINDFRKRLKSINLHQIISDVVLENEELISNSIKGNLMDGKDSDGMDIRPYYTEDPFFKTKEAALKYARWKQKITPNPNRNFLAPNLYINGYFHSSLQIDKKSLSLDSSWLDGRDIIPKYGDDVFMLGNDENVIKKIRTSLVEKISKKI